MHWLMRALSSSIGKKFVMGITGLLLCGFLVAHLAGNLLLYVSADAYNQYAAALHEQEILLLFAEIGLLLLFVAHIYLAFHTTVENRAARGANYAEKHTKQGYRKLVPALWADSWMFVSGAVVFGFLILHLADFTFEVRPDIQYGGTAADGHKDAYDKARQILTSWPSVIGYTIGSVFLGWHLAHGFASAFQSLGINHPKYNGFIRWVGIIFALTMLVGFASFPIVFMFLSAPIH